jgi:hypothetical protein
MADSYLAAVELSDRAADYIRPGYFTVVSPGRFGGTDTEQTFEAGDSALAAASGLVGERAEFINDQTERDVVTLRVGGVDVQRCRVLPGLGTTWECLPPKGPEAHQ